jgi:hypothetical protein
VLYEVVLFRTEPVVAHTYRYRTQDEGTPKANADDQAGLRQNSVRASIKARPMVEGTR